MQFNFYNVLSLLAIFLETCRAKSTGGLVQQEKPKNVLGKSYKYLSGFTFLGSRTTVKTALSDDAYFYSVNPATWATARQDCVAQFGQNASLVSIESEEEKAFLVRILAETDSSAKYFWTSGYYSHYINNQNSHVGAFIWDNGVEFGPNVPWGTGFPRPTSYNSISRVTLHFEAPSTAWLQTQYATHPHRYICEIKHLNWNPPNTCQIPDVLYQAHLQNIGWQNGWFRNGEMAGTTGQSRRLEAIKIKLEGSNNGLGVSYSGHMQDHGWGGWVNDGDVAGTTGQSRRLEAIQIKLTGNVPQYLSIKYRAHIQDIGWQEWVKDGEVAGTTGQSKRLEAIEIKIINSACFDFLI